MVGPLYTVCIYGCQWLRLGQLFFLEVLLVQQGGPIIYVYGAADGYIWADYYSGRHCRCNKVGPLNMHMWLPMASSGPIFALGSAPDATGWAQCVCICGCRWLRLV